MKTLEECFKSSPKYSLKYSNYFEVYETFLSQYRGKKITIAEVGVFHGGSLHMWREYFGNSVRVIGIDADPNAIELAKEGFEIFIGDSKDPDFWPRLYSEIGKIDVLIDDGGHTNAQQSQALISSIENMNDKGLIIIEDAYQSYSRDFGNPSPFSFIQLSKLLVNKLMIRTMKDLRPGCLSNHIYSISFFERMVVFQIRESINRSELVDNESIKRKAFDYRHNDNGFFLKAVKGLDDLLNLKFESIGNRYRFFKPLNRFIKSRLGAKTLKILYPIGKLINLFWFGIFWLRNLAGWVYFRKFK